MKQLPITTADIWAIPVPVDAANLKIDKYTKSDLNFTLNGYLDFIDIGFKAELLGTATADEIDFDAALVVESKPIPNTAFVYKNYGTGVEWYYSEQASLRSAIHAAGYYFVNPYGDKPHKVTVFENVHYDMSIEDENAKWQAAQSNVVEKLVIIKKV